MIDESVSALPPTVYRASKGRRWAMLAGSLAFVAAGVWFLVDHSTVKMVLAGALAVPFFGLTAVLSGQRLIQDRPELVLDAAGIEHVMLGRLAWEEIAGARIRLQQVRGASQRFVELVLHDPQSYLARAPRLVRSTAAMNARLGFGPANMPENTLPVSAETVLAEMRRHRPELLVQ